MSYHLLIDGQLIDDARSMDVIDPTTGQPVARSPGADTGQAERAIAAGMRGQAGTIWVNQHIALPLDVTFGGANESGIGLQNGVERIKDFTQLRVLNARLAA